MFRTSRRGRPDVSHDSETDDPFVTQLRREAGYLRGRTPLSKLLSPAFLAALAETAAACRVPQRTQITQARWAVFARMAAQQRDTLGVLTVAAGGVPALYVEYFSRANWPRATFMQNVAAWREAGLLAVTEKHGKRSSMKGLWIPSLTETMIWAASHEAETKQPGALSRRQLWRLALDAVAHHAYPPTEIEPPTSGRWPRKQATDLIGRIVAYERGFGAHPCQRYWSGAIFREDGYLDYLQQRDEALAFVRNYEGASRYVNKIKTALKPFWILDLTEKQIATLLEIRDELIPINEAKRCSEQGFYVG